MYPYTRMDPCSRLRSCTFLGPLLGNMPCWNLYHRSLPIGYLGRRCSHTARSLYLPATIHRKWSDPI
jgi:hypothetical protein